MAERGRYNRPANPKAPRIDREKTCPFLVRVFVRAQGHNQDTDYTIDRVPPSEEHQLYTWRDSTLRELLLLLRDVAPPLRTSPLARYSLRLVFYDAQRSSYASRDLGTLSVADVLSPSPLGRADKTLEEARFVVGDYIDVAFMPGPPAVGAVEAGRGGFTRDPVPHFGREGRGGPPSRGTPVGGRGGFGGPARGGFGGPPARGGFGGVQERRGDTWAPQAPTGAWGRAAAGGGREEEMRKPAHQGWGARRESKDERAPERRRDSRSRSPVRRRSRSPVGRAKEVDVEMK